MEYYTLIKLAVKRGLQNVSSELTATDNTAKDGTIR